MRRIRCLLSNLFRPAYCLGFAAVAMAFATAAPPASAQSVWELTPYKVRVLMALEGCPELEGEVAGQILDRVTERLDYAAAARWDLETGMLPGELRSLLLPELPEVPADNLPEAWRELKYVDKIIPVVIAPAVDGYRVIGREWDVALESFGLRVACHAPSCAVLSETVEAVVRRCYTPIARVTAIETESIHLRLRASGLPTRDASLEPIRTSAVFQPMIRYEDRFGAARAVIPVPWSFLQVKEVDGGRLICELHSGVRNALSARRRGRVRQIARLIRPQKADTTLVLRSPGEDAERLVGYDLFVTTPGEEQYRFLGRTDYRGQITVPPEGDSPLSLLTVKHGSRLLARLPMVPGLHPRLEAVLPNDDQRLDAEGFLVGIQDELMDLVTRRTLLLAQARRAMEEGEFDEAERLLTEARSLKTRERFINEINQRQRVTVCDDPLSQRRVDAMFDQIKNLVIEFLNPSAVEQLTQELSRRRREAS